MIISPSSLSLIGVQVSSMGCNLARVNIGYRHVLCAIFETQHVQLGITLYHHVNDQTIAFATL